MSDMAKSHVHNVMQKKKKRPNIRVHAYNFIYRKLKNS